MVVEAELLQDGREPYLDSPQLSASLCGNMHALAPETKLVLQRAKFLSYLRDQPFVAPQINRSRSTLVTKAQPPIAGLTTATLVLCEVTFAAKCVDFRVIKSELP